jgi:4-hydroxybenzoate polyprenyltransferase
MNETATPPPTWFAWLRLARVSNLPSALSNILMGFLLINASWQPWPSLALLLLASACLYSAGMILNDYFDLHSDQANSPERPLPAGQIAPQAALMSGTFLALGGISFAALAGSLASGFIKPMIVALLLAASILLYDWVLKKTVVAPLFMGLCRTLNVLLGASVFGAEVIVHEATKLLGFDALIFWVAASVGIYVMGLTLFARDEHRMSMRWKLTLGLLIMIIGIAGIALIPEQVKPLSDINKQYIGGMFALLILLIAVTIVRSAVVAILSTKPANVKSAVITSLRSMIIFDACIVYLFRLGNVVYPLVVISLLGVALILGSRIRST